MRPPCCLRRHHTRCRACIEQKWHAEAVRGPSPCPPGFLPEAEKSVYARSPLAVMHSMAISSVTKPPQLWDRIRNCASWAPRIIETRILAIELSGFVRNGDQRSRGPQFEFFCCSACDCADCELVERDGQCLDNGESRTVAVEIYLKNKHVADVTLYEDFPGHYVGRWDWFVEEHDVKVDLPTWPPPASDEYVAVVVDSPCGSNYKEQFRVFVGESNENDSTAPEGVKLSIASSDGDFTRTITEADATETLLIMPGDETITVNTPK